MDAVAAWSFFRPGGRSLSTPLSAACIAFLVNVVSTRRPPESICGVVEPGALQLVADHGQHEAALAAVHVVGPLLGQLGELAVVLVGLGGVERAHRDHAPEHVVVALGQAGAAGCATVGAEVVRRVQDRGEHRRLGDGELLGGLVEVGVGRGLDAVGAAAEVDGVQVALEDRRLGLLLLHLQGEERLLDLARKGALLAEVEDLDVLLGDRRRALGGVALRVGERGAEDALRVDAAVGVERAVLSGDRRVLHRLRDVGQRDRLAVLLREAADLALPARVVDEGGLGLEGLVGVGDRGVAVGEVADAGQDHRRDQPTTSSHFRPADPSPTMRPPRRPAPSPPAPFLGSAVA